MVETERKGCFLNPYVMQMDKLTNSLKSLTDTFLNQESHRINFTRDEIKKMYHTVRENVCENCEKKDTCHHGSPNQSYQIMYEIIDSVNEYGVEMTPEVKKHLQKSCVKAPRFLRETLECTQMQRKDLIWNNKMVENRAAYIQQMNRFASIVKNTTRELNAGIFQDEYLESKIKNHLKKSGVKMLSSVFYITPEGRYEIHLTVRAAKGHVVATKDLVREVGKIVGRSMMLTHGERTIVVDEYCTIACIEGAGYYTLQGVAKIGRGCDSISGDTFLMTDLPGGKKAVALSDGMGVGEGAFQESARVIDILEELLDAGFPVSTAVQMMNTALVIGREDVRFTTIDIAVLDLYTACCQFVKAGAAVSYIKREGEIETIKSMSLPIGVLRDIEVDVEKVQMKSGDFLIMMTDGIVDALRTETQEKHLREYVRNTQILNPKEMAHQILGKVLELSGEVPLDDMTVLVIGIWKI